MKTRTTRRRPDAPALTCVLGEPETRLRDWLARHPEWEVWREDSIWLAACGPAVVTSRDFAAFVTALEELRSARMAPAADYPAAGYGGLPDIA
jgi:hypothetical protein